MLRPLLDSDKPIIKEWISRDPHHVDLNEEFFYRPDGFAFAANDKLGPVLFLKIEPMDAQIVRIHVQFDNTQTRRNAVALARIFPDVCAAIRQANLRYLLFDSISDPLIRFCQKRFGFVHIADTTDYFLDLTSSKTSS